jgi:hypothetical protein
LFYRTEKEDFPGKGASVLRKEKTILERGFPFPRAEEHVLACKRGRGEYFLLKRSSGMMKFQE